MDRYLISFRYINKPSYYNDSNDYREIFEGYNQLVLDFLLPVSQITFKTFVY